MNRLSALLAVFILLAGCTAPTAQGPTGVESALELQTPASGSDALPVNESRVYDRVAASLDSTVAEPTLRTVTAEDDGNYYYGRQMDAFQRLLLDPDESGGSAPAAYYDPDEHRVTVLLHDGVPANATNESELRAILAHEYAHAVAFQDDQYQDQMVQAAGGTTTDTARIRQAMIEGSAMYVSDEYSEQYLDGIDESRAMARDYRQGDEIDRYIRGPYRFGGPYFDERLSSPANLTPVFRAPPETTEQLIHGLEPTEEPPADLRVTVSTDESMSASQADTVGELFVRDLLGGHLSERRAATAATGWGNDKTVMLWNYDANGSDQRNYVWALKWDDEQNATEFERAFADYLDARGERLSDQRWRVVGEQFRLDRVSDRTVVAVIGASDTVGRVQISATDGNVSVTVAAS